MRVHAMPPAPRATNNATNKSWPHFTRERGQPSVNQPMREAHLAMTRDAQVRDHSSAQADLSCVAAALTGEAMMTRRRLMARPSVAP